MNLICRDAPFHLVAAFATVASLYSCTSRTEGQPELGRYTWQSEHGMVVLDLVTNHEYAMPGHGNAPTRRGFYTKRADTVFLSQPKGASMPLLVRGDSLVMPGMPEIAYIRER